MFFFVLLTLAQPSFAQFSFNSIDLNPGVNGSEAFTNLDYAVLGTKLLFSGDNGSGVELMISDGTVAGTTLLKQIGTATNPSYPSEFALMNNKVYFRASPY